MLLILALAAFPALAAAIAPGAVVDPAVQIAGGFNLEGRITPNGLDTTYHFEYGTTTSYGSNVPMPDADAGTGSYYYPSVSVSQPVTGLQPNTTYHYRLVATNSDGPSMSGDETFTTSANPDAPSPSGYPYSGPQTGSSPVHKGKKVVVKEAKDQGRTILTSTAGRTLYSLSAETHGKFICTRSSGCLGLWHPLKVPAGARPTGPVKLGTIKRPDGGVQVTFHGRPLYSFAQDLKPGQVKGEGLKDVGTWHAVTVSAHRSQLPRGEGAISPRPASWMSSGRRTPN